MTLPSTRCVSQAFKSKPPPALPQAAFSCQHRCHFPEDMIASRGKIACRIIKPTQDGIATVAAIPRATETRLARVTVEAQALVVSVHKIPRGSGCAVLARVCGS
ncbi:hypothetical protein [Paracoccus xiamenensis]|uniref:hypothetical protein n=1 Tax=Paracoccus xiamenensis TaxID=2714901 RepID=UPI001407BF47|nr:hypothetical protein [Paracoccus xiamenensis]NHF72513.1 hypothetical protein [Paracoccus xiamenensis]